MSKAAQRQFLVRAPGFTGYFATKSGGNPTSEVTKAYDGGASKADTLTANAEYDNVTVGRPFDPDRDWETVRRMHPQVGRLTGPLSITPTDRDLIPVGEPMVYPEATLVGITNPEVDASSGEPATFELEFAVDDVA